MVDEIDLGWLTGIIDGEGNFTIRIRRNNRTKSGYKLRVWTQLIIVNTNKEIIEKVIRILDEMGVNHSKITERNRKGNARKQYLVGVYGKGLRKLLPLIKDYSCKKEEIEILMEVLEMRYVGKGEFTEEEIEKIFELRERLVEIHGLHARKLKKYNVEDFIVKDE